MKDADERWEQEREARVIVPGDAGMRPRRGFVGGHHRTARDAREDEGQSERTRPGVRSCLETRTA